MIVDTEEILKHLLNGTKYRDSDLCVADGTLDWHGVHTVIVRPDEVLFCGSAFNEGALRFQQVLFSLMQRQGIIDREEKFPSTEVLCFSGYSIPRCKPEPKFEPLTVPVCDDTRELL